MEGIFVGKAPSPSNIPFTGKIKDIAINASQLILRTDLYVVKNLLTIKFQYKLLDAYRIHFHVNAFSRKYLYW